MFIQIWHFITWNVYFYYDKVFVSLFIDTIKSINMRYNRFSHIFVYYNIAFIFRSNRCTWIEVVFFMS